jgi:hypothetical protein
MRSYILLSGALHGGACLVFHWLCYASLPRAERETQPQRAPAARLIENFKVLKILLINGGNFVKIYTSQARFWSAKSAGQARPNGLRQTRTKTRDYQRGAVTCVPKTNVQENRKFAGGAAQRTFAGGEQSCRKIIISIQGAASVSCWPLCFTDFGVRVWVRLRNNTALYRKMSGRESGE